MALPFNLRQVSFSVEAAFAENAESPSSNTWSDIIYCSAVNATFNQDRIRDQSLQSRMNIENLSNPGPRDGTLELTMYLFGHQAVTTGSLTATSLYTLLKGGLGGGSTAATGTTVSAATSGSSVTFTATTGWAAGMIGRLGAKGDARGDGQGFVVNTVGTPVTFLTALGATPSASDVIYAMQQVYHDESQAGSLSTYRFQIAHATTGAQYHAMGCQLSGIKFPSVQPGALPQITLTYKVAYWQRQSTTFPNTGITPTTNYTAPSTGGSFFLQDWTSGSPTTTRNTVQAANVSLEIDLGLEPVNAPGGNGTYQLVVGWQRTKCQPKWTFDVPWVTAYETWWDTSNFATSPPYKHLLYTLNVADGKAVAIYSPRVFPIGNRPSYPVDVNKQNYVRVVALGTESTTTTSELTRSAVRIAMG